jgi:hypothetical protein
VVSFQALVKNATKLFLMGLGGVLGAAAMVWARVNSDWITIRIPGVMVPGSDQPLEYEARVWGVVALAFATGVLTCCWLVIAVWLRSVRRERRLARVLEQVEAKMRLRGVRDLASFDETLALPSSGAAKRGGAIRDFEELEHDEDAIPRGSNGLPSMYDDPDDGEPDDSPVTEPAPGGRGEES